MLWQSFHCSQTHFSLHPHRMSKEIYQRWKSLSADMCGKHELSSAVRILLRSRRIYVLPQFSEQKKQENGGGGLQSSLQRKQPLSMRCADCSSLSAHFLFFLLFLLLSFFVAALKNQTKKQTSPKLFCTILDQ